MKITSSSKFINIILFLFTISIWISSFIIEDKITLTVNDLILLGSLIISFSLIFYYTNKLYNPILLFYDFNIIIALSRYNASILFIILFITLFILTIFINKYSYKNFSNSVIVKTFCIITISIFFAKGAYLIFCHYINQTPLLFVDVLIINLFYHVFFYILTSLNYFSEYTQFKISDTLDKSISILVNFIYSTMLSYLSLTFYTFLGLLPLIVIIILNTALALLYMEDKKYKYENNCLINLQQTVKNSLLQKYDVFQKFYIYLNGINKILPSSLSCTYLLLNNTPKITPLIFSSKDNLSFDDLSFNKETINDFKSLYASKNNLKFSGKDLINYFPLIKNHHLENSTFIIMPLYLNTKTIGFTMLLPRFDEFNNNTFKYLSNAQDCLSIILELYYTLINRYPLWIPTYDELTSCIKDFTDTKLSFTINKIEIINENLEVNFLDKDFQNLIISHLNNIDKIFFQDKNTLYILNSLASSLSISYNMSLIQDDICKYTKTSSLKDNFKITAIEYPTDYNSFNEIINKLK